MHITNMHFALYDVHVYGHEFYTENTASHINDLRYQLFKKVMHIFNGNKFSQCKVIKVNNAVLVLHDFSR